MVGFLKAKFAGGDGEPEAAYRTKLAGVLQKCHLATNETVLTDVFIAPRLLAPQGALAEDALLDDGTAALHYLWPDLAGSVATVPPPSITLSELIAHSRRVLVSGQPGAGKSTLLAYLAIQIAGGGKEGQWGVPAGALPVYLHLSQLERQFTPAGQGDVSSPDPLEILQDILNHSGLTTRGFKKVLVSAAEAGRLFLFLDGWDELPGAGLGHAGRWLNDLLAAYPESRVLMSSPLRGYGPLYRLGFLVTGILPWRRGQAMALGQHWAAANGASRLPWISKYWRPGQTALVTWLRLQQTARTEDSGGPPARSSNSYLLEHTINKALSGQLAVPDAEHVSFLARRLVQQLAHKMIADRVWDVPEAEVAEFADALLAELPPDLPPMSRADMLQILASSGLLAEAVDSIRFKSPLVRDYLAGMYLVEHAELADVIRHVKDAHWTEAISFYLAFIGPQGNFETLPEPDNFGRHLYQVAGWATGMKSAEPWRQSLLISLGKRCLDTKSPPVARLRAAAALAGTGDPGVGVLMHQLVRQSEPAMRQVALAVLARVAPRDVIGAAPRMMSDSDPGVRAVSVHALAWIDLRAGDEALLEALYARDPVISGAAAEALSLNATEDGYRALKAAALSRQFSARQAARVGLRLIGAPWAEELLAKSLKADGLTTSLLVAYGDQAAARWRRVRPGDQSWLVTWAVDRGHIVPVGPAAVPFLLEALQDRETAIRARSAATLGQLAILDGIGPLKHALDDESPQVRQAAFIALAKIRRAWNTDA